MKVKVFNAKKNILKSLIVPFDNDLSSLSDEIKNEFDITTPKQTFDLNKDKSRVALNSNEAVSSINAKGYYVTEAEIKIDIGVC
jgi:uncharacterized protein YcgL (UPF0745 family)